MKKQLLSLILFGSLAASVFAYEWGGVLKNNTKVTTPDFSEYAVNQGESLYMWYSSALPFANMKFSAEGLYKFNFESANGTNTITNILDVDLFKFAGKSGNISYSAGRFAYYDATGAVFAQNIDGIHIRYSAPSVRIGFAAGYTGLLNEMNVSMQDSAGSVIGITQGLYSLAYPYVMAGINCYVPVIAKNQSLQVEALGFIDIGAEKKNRYFLNAVLSGPVGSAFAYNLSTSLESVDFESFMNFTSLRMEVYPADNLILGLAAEYASGNQGSFKSFSGITTRYIGSDACTVRTTEELSVKTEAVYILNNVSLSGSVAGIFACPESFDFSGIDASLACVCPVFTDFQASAKMFAFFDMTENKKNNYGLNLNLTFGF